MKLSDIEHSIKDGDVLLFQGTALWSKIIKFFTRSVYSHAGIAIWVHSPVCNEKVLAVYEAREGSGVRLFPLSVYVKRGVIIDWYSVDQSVNRKEMVRWALKLWGNRYATFWQFWRSFTLTGKYLGDLFGIPSKIDKDRPFCFWIVSYLLVDIGGFQIPEDERKTLETTTGADLTRYTCLHRQGWIKEL